MDNESQYAILNLVLYLLFKFYVISLVMEHRYIKDNINIFEPSISPDLIRGLSLGKITERYGTAGLYTRITDTLEDAGLGDSELIQSSLQLGLGLHIDDLRTNGNYVDHIMRVALHTIETLGVKDENIITASLLHDIFEMHLFDLILALTGEKVTEPPLARQIGHQALSQFTNLEVVDIVSAVTNPVIATGEDKIAIYQQHVINIIQHYPAARIVKLGDFIDNAVGNHATNGKLRQKLDNKYSPLYTAHKNGLYLPDSLISEDKRSDIARLLDIGRARSIGRIAAQKVLKDNPDILIAK